MKSVLLHQQSRSNRCVNMKCVVVFVFLIAVNFVQVTSTTVFNNGLSPFDTSASAYSSVPAFADGLRRRCPICDSSVYSYCSEKLFHDSCCCRNSNNPYDRLPYQCQFADCSFLHSNSCQEHKLITACCCTNLYMFNRK